MDLNHARVCQFARGAGRSNFLNACCGRTGWIRTSAVPQTSCATVRWSFTRNFG
jgi:hypothetical protein